MNKNLALLRARMDPFCSFVFKKDCLDLPAKVYQKRRFELGKEERRLYNQLRDTFLLELGKEDFVPVSLVIPRQLRLQQIASGFLPGFGEDDEPTHPIRDNARL